MNLDLSPLVDAVVERSRGRLAARDRLDALDEAATSPGPAALARHQQGVAEDLVDEALDDILSALAVRANRQALRDLRDGCTPAADLDSLMRSGLVIDAWTGGAPHVSVVGAQLLDRLEHVCTDATRRLRGSLGDPRAD